MYEKLRQINLQRAETDELVALYSFGTVMATSYRDFQVPEPDWLKENLAGLRREITSRHRDMLESRLRDIRSRREALATPEEKRSRLDAEEKRLIEALGGKSE